MTKTAKTLMPNGGRKQSMEKALSKTYKVWGSRHILKGKRVIIAGCGFPAILIGHKIKISLADI